MVPFLLWYFLYKRETVIDIKKKIGNGYSCNKNKHACHFKQYILIFLKTVNYYK